MSLGRKKTIYFNTENELKKVKTMNELSQTDFKFSK